MKTEETYRLEEVITLATWKPGMIGCAEVGLGDKGIVDYMTVELGGRRLIRCYELKITRSDFLSDARKSFVGDLNFYVIPSGLWDDVKAYMEPWVGCWTVDRDGHAHRKRPARRRSPQITASYATGRTILALQRQHLKYVERDWQDAQLARPMTDYGGRRVSVGSKVRYHGREWVVSDVSRERVDTVLAPICHLEPYGRDGDGTTAKPASLTIIGDATDCTCV